MMTPADVLDHLARRGRMVQRYREGGRAQCPSHNDSTPSLDVRPGRGGRVLVICRAGCRTSAVLRAAGLRWQDLFSEPFVRPTITRRPRGAADLLRDAAEELARSQPWYRHLDRYAAADSIRTADRVRTAAREDDPNVWEILAAAAALTTTAENLLAAQP
jgi:hypothetical protein